MSNAINHLSNAQYLTKLDIHRAYRRLWIATRYEWKIEFCTHYSH